MQQRRTRRHKKMLSFLAMCVALLLVIPVQAAAANRTGAAQTAPPPQRDMLPAGTFDPSFKYLDDGHGGISNLGNGKVRISGDTIATQDVDTIGVKMYLQKWNGSSWVTLNPNAANHQDYNNNYISAQEDFTVETGYYYRVRSVHWIEEGNVLEQGEKVTGSYLVN